MTTAVTSKIGRAVAPLVGIRRPVGHPQVKVAVCILAPEQYFAVEDRKIGRIETVIETACRATDAGQLVRTCRCSISLPQAETLRGIDAGEHDDLSLHLLFSLIGQTARVQCNALRTITARQ